MKYQLGISGEIVSFFLEFDHAWDAGKARERERERDGKTLFLPLPHHSLLSSWYSRINIESTSLSPWQHTREAEYTPELRDRETTSHHTISLCRSVCERKILCQKKKISMWKSFNFFAGSRPEPKVRNLNSPTPLMLLYLFGVMCSSFKIVVWRIFAAIFPPLMLYTIC